MRWERVQLHAQQQISQHHPELGHSGPGKRWGHTCNAVKGGRLLYVFGGYGQDNCQTNQVHVFDTAKQTWGQPVVKGTPPTPRDSHSCTAVGDNLYVFGGTDGMNPLKDLYILDTSSHTWICPTVRGEGPEPREGHSAALVGKRLFIFGGCGKSPENNEEVYYNDLYVLNTETFVWKRATTSGTPPSARDSHTCSSWKNKIIVIGGEDGHDYYLSDVHILDADTLIWKELNTTGMILPPRAGHSTIALGKSLFVFGGFTDAQNLYDDLYLLDADTGVWTRLMATGEGPSARFSVAGDSLDPLKSGTLALIGGCNKSLEALDDMYYLHTGLVVKDERKLEKLSLRKQLKLKCQEQNLNNPINDKALIRVEMTGDMYQPVPLSSYGQPRRDGFPLHQVQVEGKKIFHAKVTESFPNGYAIETIIDGRPLRGILFANKSSSIQTANNNSSRKRSSEESTGTLSNGDCKSNSKSSKSLNTGLVDNGQTDGVHEESTLNETVVASPNLKNSCPSNTLTLEDPANQEPKVVSLNLNDDKTGDDALDSGTGVLKDSASASADLSVTFSPKQDEKGPKPFELKDLQISM